jgi:hypothetical protein
VVRATASAAVSTPSTSPVPRRSFPHPGPSLYFLYVRVAVDDIDDRDVHVQAFLDGFARAVFTTVNAWSRVMRLPRWILLSMVCV